MIGHGYLGLGLVCLAVGLLAKFGHLPRFIVRFITPTVQPASLEEVAEDRRRQAEILTRIGRQAQQPDLPRERRIVHPIVHFERQMATLKAQHGRTPKPSNSDEAA